MSPPAQKSALPEVSTSPLMPASVARRSAMAASGTINSSLTTFIGRPGRSIVAMAMPSPPTFKVIVSVMLTPAR
jgi:hypothetical protein